jgi:hypothetical protein
VRRNVARMDPTLTRMLEELRSIPLWELRLLLDENIAEHAELRRLGEGPGDEDFDQNSMMYVVLATAVDERRLFA